MDLIGVTQIAELLGLTRAGAHKLVGREGFPAWISKVGNRRLWQREDVEEWGIATRRICPEHKHPSIGEQVVAGRLVGRCADDFLYAVPPSFVPGAENQA